MKVAFVASEAAPFAKTGGLGDVISALPLALKQEGVEVAVFMPSYGDIPEEFKDRMQLMDEGEVPVSWRRQYLGIESLKHQGVQYYFINNKYYFWRWGLYGYPDDGERFIYFSKAVLETMKILEEPFDVIHAHDWQTAALPVFMDAFYRRDPFFKNTRTVFTIHNLQYQGIFGKEVIEDPMGLPWDYFHHDALEFHGQANLMKGGIRFCDRLTTVSPNYSEEIKTVFYGEGLEGVLFEENHKLRGIINGIDTDSFNPKKDPKIHRNYDKNTLQCKGDNKKHLQRRFKLPEDKNIPVIGLISRFVEQKGIDLIERIMDEVLQQNLQFIILGSGEKKYEDYFKGLAYDYHDKVGVYIGFDEALAREIYAGCDFFLMPSRFEPCGLGQLIAMRYGTVPIVRETGGLRDTIVPYNQYTGEGYGFTFSHYNAHDLMETIKRALSVYRDEEVMKYLRLHAMERDVSWRRSAREYRSLYQELI